MTVVFLIAAMFAYKTTILTRMILPRMETLVKSEEDRTYLLKDGDHIEQTFRYPSDELLSAGMQISLNEKKQKRLLKEDKKKDLGSVHMEVLNEAGECLMSADYAVSVLADDQNLLASFSGTQAGFAGRKLTIVLDAQNIHEDVELAIGYAARKAEHTALFVNGEEKEYTFNIQTADRQFLYWKTWGMFGAALIYALLIGTYLLLAVFRQKPEKVFLFAGSALALLYLLLLPPLSVPDEEAHFKQAYSCANRLMGRETDDPETILMDKEDFHALQMFETTPSLPEYDRLKEGIAKSGREEGTVSVPHSDTRAPAVTYLPGIIGILLGRMLGLNGLLVIYLGRICSALFYLLTMYLFIRMMDYAKPAAFVMAVLPMTLQQCCSYSYDSVVIEFAFLYFAVLFRLIYRKETVKKPQIFWYALFMVILSICKGGTYMPLCLLTLLIPAERFLGKRQKKMFVGAMALTAVVSFLASTLSSVLFVVNPTAEQTAASYLAGENFGVSGLLEQPMEFILISGRTLFLSGDAFLENMLGMQLGWLDISVSRIVIYGMLLLILLSVLRIEDKKKRETPDVTRRQKLSYLTVILLSAGMIFVSMFISWTPKESKEIFGIQGRYFLPMLPLAVMLLYNRCVVLKKDIGRKVIFAAICLQCAAIYDILTSLERVL